MLPRRIVGMIEIVNGRRHARVVVTSIEVVVKPEHVTLFLAGEHSAIGVREVAARHAALVKEDEGVAIQMSTAMREGREAGVRRAAPDARVPFVDADAVPESAAGIDAPDNVYAPRVVPLDRRGADGPIWAGLIDEGDSGCVAAPVTPVIVRVQAIGSGRRADTQRKERGGKHDERCGGKPPTRGTGPTLHRQLKARSQRTLRASFLCHPPVRRSRSRRGSRPPLCTQPLTGCRRDRDWGVR